MNLYYREIEAETLIIKERKSLSLFKTQEEQEIMKTRTTSNRITELRPGEIFVFGSNLQGAHGGGAAYLAYKKWGAIWGQGVGLQG